MFTAVKHSTNKPYGPVVGFVCALTVAFGLLLGSGSQSVAAQATPNGDENASLKGTVSGLYSLDEAGHAVAGVPIHVELTGNAVFTETATNVWEGETTLEPLSLQWESDGTQPVSYKVYFDSAKEIRSPLSRSEGVVAREAQKVSQSVPVATAAQSYPEHDYADDYAAVSYFHLGSSPKLFPHQAPGRAKRFTCLTGLFANKYNTKGMMF